MCGSRDWNDRGAIATALYGYGPGDTLIHGSAPGADTIAAEIGTGLGMTIEPYPAEWNKHGKAAGPIRNQRMLDEGKPHCVIGFPVSDSRGTWDMIKRAVDAGVTVIIPGTPMTKPGGGR